MGAKLGDLVVSLEANMAKFTSDMGHAAQQTEQAMGKIDGAVNLAKGAIGALGVAAAGMKLVSEVRGVIEYADHLNDLSKSTDVAIEVLDGLALATKQSGADLDGAADSINKLSVNIGKAPEKYRALGISAKDPIEAFKQLADIYNKIEDPQKRAALAAEALGKSWKTSAPLLAEGGKAIGDMIQKGHDLSGVTKETAEMADKFNDSMAELETAQRSLARELARDLLPGLTVITQAMADGYRESGKWQAIMMGMERLGAVLYSDEYQNDAVKLENLTKKLDELYASKKRIASMPEAGQKIAEWIVDPRDRDAEIAQAEQDMVLLRAKMVEAGKPAPSSPSKDKPTEDKVNKFLGGAGDAKALLDGKLKVIEDAFAKERDAIAFQGQYSQEQRNQDLISLDAYNAARIESINNGLNATLSAYGQEIEQLRKARAAAVEKPERAQLDNQIRDKQAAMAKARIDAGQAMQMNALSLTAAQSDLNKTMREWNIQQDQSAAQMQFSNDLYGASALEVAKLTEAGRIELDIEEKIRLAKEKGAITDESIARYRADAKAKAGALNPALTQANGNQIRDSLMTPDESESRLYANRIADLEAYQALSLQNTIIGNELIERENKRHANVVMDIQSSNNLQALSMASQSAGQLYAVLKNAGAEKTALAKSLFLVQKAIAVAEILINTEKGAATALGLGPFGIPMATIIRAMGYASAGIVAGTAIAEASAEGGFDVPAGRNPVTQLHEKEMVLPKAQAEVIRGLAANGGRGGAGGMSVTYAPNIQIDGSTDMVRNQQMIKSAVQQGNADLVDKLQRAGRI